MADKSDITPEISDKIIADISDNIPYELAAEAAGICETTLYNWINYGIRDRAKGLMTLHVSFLKAIKGTEVEKIRKLMKDLESNKKNWQSSAWILERRWRKYFGQDAGIIAELQSTFNELKAKFEAQQNK